MGAEITLIQQLVCVDDAYHAHSSEVQPFGHHLRAYQKIRLSVLEIANDALVGGARACGVEVHASHFGLGEASFDGSFNLFRTGSHVEQVSLFTLWTVGGHIIVGATIVTHHFVHFQMEGQRHIAACAVRRPSTAAALEHRTIATAIKK